MILQTNYIAEGVLSVGADNELKTKGGSDSTGWATMFLVPVQHRVALQLVAG